MTSKPIFDPTQLQQCISCGFCLPACPTYRLTGDEASSPRGRIALMRAIDTGTVDVLDATARHQGSFCLGCRACEPVCPAGVSYGSLLEQLRDAQWTGRHLPIRIRPLLRFAASPRIIRLVGRLRRHAKPTTAPRHRRHAPARLLRTHPVPGRQPRRGRHAARPSRHPPTGLLRSAPRPQRPVGDRQRDGRASSVPTTAGSSPRPGAAPHIWRPSSAGTASSTTRRPFSKTHRHCSLSSSTAASPVSAFKTPAICATGSADSTRHDKLLSMISEYVEIPGAADCCGAAGTYSILRKRDSRRVLADKIAALARARPGHPRRGQPRLPAPAHHGGTPSAAADPGHAPRSTGPASSRHRHRTGAVTHVPGDEVAFPPFERNRP